MTCLDNVMYNFILDVNGSKLIVIDQMYFLGVNTNEIDISLENI